MEPVKIQLGSSDNSYSPSASIWKDVKITDLQRQGNSNNGLFQRIDFSKFRTSTSFGSEAYYDQGFKAFGDTGATISAVAAQAGGVTLASDGDNEGASIASMVLPFQISRSHKRLAFEARIKTSTIADTKHGFFLGLAGTATLSATVPITAAGALADINLCGFHRLEGDGDYVDTVYKADGVTQVTVQSDAQVLAADTYIKLGFRYEPVGDLGSYYLRFFANGLPLSTAYQVASAAGTDFPNDVPLGFIFAVLNATASTPGSTTIQWAQIAQDF
jgi:hypothetical protein